MDVPPSRYKVVEKGRCLVVVDTLTGAEVTRSPAPRYDPPPRPRAQPQSREPERASSPQRGTSTFTTERWYDNRGPRQVTLGENATPFLVFAGVVLVLIIGLVSAWFGWPGLVVVAVILANTRKQVRGGITAWLDSLEQG